MCPPSYSEHMLLLLSCRWSANYKYMPFKCTYPMHYHNLNHICGNQMPEWVWNTIAQLLHSIEILPGCAIFVILLHLTVSDILIQPKILLSDRHCLHSRYGVAPLAIQSHRSLGALS